MKAVPQIINNECGMETEGEGGGMGPGSREGGCIGWYSLGGHKVFLCMCVCVRECGLVAGACVCIWGLNSSLGPLAKTPVGLSWQTHEAAWQEESCI